MQISANHLKIGYDDKIEMCIRDRSIHHRSKYAKPNKHSQYVQRMHQLNRSGFERMDRNGKPSNHRNVYQLSLIHISSCYVQCRRLP